jgi:hypothetical protein
MITIWYSDCKRVQLSECQDQVLGSRDVLLFTAKAEILECLVL